METWRGRPSERWIPFQLWSDRQSNRSRTKTRTDMNQGSHTHTLTLVHKFMTAMRTRSLCSARARTPALTHSLTHKHTNTHTHIAAIQSDTFVYTWDARYPICCYFTQLLISASASRLIPTSNLSIGMMEYYYSCHVLLCTIRKLQSQWFVWPVYN